MSCDICKECADKEGLIPKDKVVGAWHGVCDWCRKATTLTGRRDYRRPGERPATLEDIFIYEANLADKE